MLLKNHKTAAFWAKSADAGLVASRNPASSGRRNVRSACPHAPPSVGRVAQKSRNIEIIRIVIRSKQLSGFRVSLCRSGRRLVVRGGRKRHGARVRSRAHHLNGLLFSFWPAVSQSGGQDRKSTRLNSSH